MELIFSQGAISHQIKALEQHLGVLLVKKNGRALALTVQGEAYLPNLTNALNIISVGTRRIENTLQRRVSQRATLTVNVFSTFATHWLNPRLSEFCTLVPSVDVQLSTAVDLSAFDPNQYDVSIRCLNDLELNTLKTHSKWQNVSYSAFMADAMTPLCSPSVLATLPKTPKPQNLKTQTLIQSHSTPFAWNDWLALSGISTGRSVRPKAQLRFDHGYQTLQAATQGLGFALGAPNVVRDLINCGLLCAPFPNLIVDAKSYYWIRSIVLKSAGPAEQFCEWLAKAAKQ
jgi:LysR family transcriptional regulator, glycine cleavage system transcriptional activator